MKKVLFILIAVAMMSFYCPDNSTRVSWNCGSTCLTVEKQLTGFTSIDNNIAQDPYRKHSLSEMIAFGNAKNELCD